MIKIRTKLKLWIISKFHPLEEARDAARFSLSLAKVYEGFMSAQSVYDHFIEMGEKYARDKHDPGI